jgi:hypothetical protein
MVFVVDKPLLTDQESATALTLRIKNIRQSAWVTYLYVVSEGNL